MNFFMVSFKIVIVVKIGIAKVMNLKFQVSAILNTDLILARPECFIVP